MFFLRGITVNFLIKKKLQLSIWILFGALLVSLLEPLVSLVRWPGLGPAEAADKLRILQLALTALAVLNASVALLFNRFKHAATSDKYPSIVQDTVVIACFVIAATFWAPDKLFTTSAIGALVIGLAVQDTLGNLFAGLAIQVEKPFRVGDWIRAAQNEGQVMEVTWRATKIRTKAGTQVVIPNNVLSKDVVLNYSQPLRPLRLEHTIGLGYEAPPNTVKRVVLETIAGIPEILREPPPDVLLGNYADFSIHYRCRFWIDDYGASEPIMDKFTTLLYYRLKRAGLVVPYPIRDVRIAEQQIAFPAGARDQRLDFVQKMDLFGGLSTETKEQIAVAMEKSTFASGEKIVRQADAGDSMFFIARGTVEIALETDGARQPIATLGEGDFFGEMALLTGEPRAATALAVGDVEAYQLSKQPFRKILLQDPEISEKVSRVMAERRQVLESKTAELQTSPQSRAEVHKSVLTRMRRFFGLSSH